MGRAAVGAWGSAAVGLATGLGLGADLGADLAAAFGAGLAGFLAGAGLALPAGFAGTGFFFAAGAGFFAAPFLGVGLLAIS